MNKIFQNAKRGFTLVELLIVIIIIAVLAGVVLVAIDPAQQRARAGATTLKANTGAVCRSIALCIVQTGDPSACTTFADPTSVNMATPAGSPNGSTYDISTTAGEVEAVWDSGGGVFTMTCPGSGTGTGVVTCADDADTYTCAGFQL